MAYEHRKPIFNFSGSLSAGCTALDTTLSSPSFVELETIATGPMYIPMVLANDAQGKAEIVWITNHAAASSSVTVVRGREGTSAQPFSAGDVIRCGPTLRDVVPYRTRADLPNDAHLGMRALISDEGLVVERSTGGWNDSAPFRRDPARRHHWQQAGVTCPHSSTLQTVSGLSTAGNHSGEIATMSSGQCTLNLEGVWALTWTCFYTSSTNGVIYLEMRWPAGAFLMGNQQGSTSHRVGSSGWQGNQIPLNTWTGYVNQTQAEIPIQLGVAQMNANSGSLTGGQFDFMAEYLGG